MNTKLKVISLFSGIGGSSYGYKKAGCEVIAAVEFLPNAVSNYLLNNPTAKTYCKDIRKLDPLEILKELKLQPGELDILDGSPPCTGFSIAGLGHHKKVKINNPKQYSNTHKHQRVDDLFGEYIRFVKHIQPKTFVAENVKGMIQGKFKGFFNNILKELSNCGYIVEARLMDSQHYKVPQTRKRIIIRGIRKDLNKKILWPKRLSETAKLKDYLKFKEKDNSERYELKEGNQGYERYHKVIPGENFSVLYERKRLFNFERTSWDRPAPTIAASANVYHPDEPRSFSLKEYYKIFGLGENFQLKGSFYKKTTFLGRMVVPAITENLAIYIEKELV